MSNLEWEIRSITTQSALKKFLEKNHKLLDKYDWTQVVRCQGFSESLIPEYEENLSWSFLCTFNRLSTSVMDAYSHKLVWYSVSTFQPLDKEFIEKYQHQLSLDKLKQNEKIPSHLIKFINEIYEKNNDPEHHKRWDYNLSCDRSFCPKDFKGKYKDYTDKTLMSGTIAWEEAQEKKLKISNKKSKSKSKLDKPSQKAKVDYTSMTKSQLKEILASRNVKTLYHDTLDVLRKKCIESE